MKNLYYHSAKEKGMWRSWIQYPYKTHRSRTLSAQLEVVWGKKVSPGFSFHIGDRGSETPVDVHVSFYWLAFFWGCNWKGLGALCEKIGRGHKRNISLKFHDKSMWWELWYDDDMGYDDHHLCDGWRKPKLWPWSMGRRKYRSWMCLRRGSIDLNPLDAFFGSRKYKYEDIEIWVTSLNIGQFQDDEYPVIFKLQKQTRQRDHGPRWVRHATDMGYVADWRCEQGIPFRNDSWKGDCVYGSGVHVDDIKAWHRQAEQALIEDIIKDRAKYNYRPPVNEENA